MTIAFDVDVEVEVACSFVDYVGMHVTVTECSVFILSAAKWVVEYHVIICSYHVIQQFCKQQCTAPIVV